MDEKFIKVSVELLDMIDETKDYELQLALTLIYLTRLNYEYCGDSYLWTSASMLAKQFGKYTNINDKAMDKQKNKFIDGLVDLRDRALIEFDSKKNKPALKDELFINVKPLLDLANKEPFVKLNVNDFLSIMSDDTTLTVNREEVTKNAVESYLFWMLFSIQGEWNVDNMKTLKRYEGEVTRYIGDKGNELADLVFVFSNSSVDTLRKRKHVILPLEENWCSDDYGYAYINKLIELGCIKEIKQRVRTNNGWRDMNFYYSPIFQYDDMLPMVRQWARRNNYAIKQREEKQLPKVTKQPKQDDVFSRRRRFR